MAGTESGVAGVGDGSSPPGLPGQEAATPGEAAPDTPLEDSMTPVYEATRFFLEKLMAVNSLDELSEKVGPGSSCTGRGLSNPESRPSIHSNVEAQLQSSLMMLREEKSFGRWKPAVHPIKVWPLQLTLQSANGLHSPCCHGK